MLDRCLRHKASYLNCPKQLLLWEYQRLTLLLASHHQFLQASPPLKTSEIKGPLSRYRQLESSNKLKKKKVSDQKAYSFNDDLGSFSKREARIGNRVDSKSMVISITSTLLGRAERCHRKLHSAISLSS
jgi:hypothetical protein